MSQLNRSICLRVVILMLGLMTSIPLGAAGPQAAITNWDNVKKLSAGQEIKVVMNDAKAYQGRVDRVSDEGISVSLPKGDATLARQDILRISYKTGSHRLRNAGILAAIGGGIGALAGVGFCSDSRNSCTSTGHQLAATFPLIGGVVGAALGASMPSDAWRDVYRAR